VQPRRVYAEVSQEAAFRQIKTASGPSISRSGATEGVPDRGRTFDAGSRSHVDIDTSRIFGGADHRIHGALTSTPAGLSPAEQASLY
jgi:hypothetical protein